MSRQFALIIWADAHADAEGTWTPLSEIEDSGEYLVQSVGWLLTVGDGAKTDHVSLAQSITPDDMGDHIIHIPKAMVRQTHILNSSTYSLTDPPDTNKV